VLENEHAEDEIERLRREQRQVRGRVEVEPAALPVPVEPAGELDHRGGDVDAVHAVEVLRERLREPPRPAAEVERPAAAGVHAELLERPQVRGDALGAGAQELVHAPTALLPGPLGEHRPEGVAPAQRVPVLAGALDVHGRRGVLERLRRVRHSRPSSSP
jgi:hypothetical protein